MKRTISQAQQDENTPPASTETIIAGKDEDIIMAPSVDNEGFTDRVESSDGVTTVAVVGAGPSGLMLASNLARYGVNVRIFDDRPEATSTGRADGIQPKTIETFKQLRLADSLLRKGVKIYDICFWQSTEKEALHRTGRQSHYPDELVGAQDPYILLVHQGMVEDVLIQDLADRGVSVDRASPFASCSVENGVVNVVCDDLLNKRKKTVKASYLVGCDGSRSIVRPYIPNAQLKGKLTSASWGVLDGVIDTDFPDIWSKVAVRSDAGSVLCIPRERNMTRLYIELSSEDGELVPKSVANQEYVMKKAREIMHPFRLEWKSVEWFGNYIIGQRVSPQFSDEKNQIFIAGDAAHTHSPKAAQGMNTSMHDTFNLAWKLNLASRGLSLPTLLDTYQDERHKIAQDLINFDIEHVKAFAKGEAALSKNFDDNIRFISGVGAEYDANILNQPADSNLNCQLKPGALPPPAKVTRYIDANPVDIQLDIPLLSQFRVYFFIPDIHAAKDFLSSVCAYISREDSFFSAVTALAEKSYSAHPQPSTESDSFIQPQRYTTVSKMFTYALVTRTPKPTFEIADLPSILKESPWTVYLDDATSPGCTEKYLGDLDKTSAAIANVRPDGYVGSIGTWKVDSTAGEEAGKWLEGYYAGFLKH